MDTYPVSDSAGTFVAELMLLLLVASMLDLDVFYGFTYPEMSAKARAVCQRRGTPLLHKT